MMDNPILRGYTKKVQPVIVKDKLPSAVILIASILLCGVILFLCVGTARAEEIDLNIIAKIESGNDPMAYNSRTQARGLCQITPICLKDFTKMNDYWYSDPDYLFNPAFNCKVADWYMNKRIPQLLKHYNLSDTLENRLIAYNAGIRAVVKGYCPRETRNYITKYKRIQKARS
jgi:soluble lytic murein transglycosylase-like protein